MNETWSAFIVYSWLQRRQVLAYMYDEPFYYSTLDVSDVHKLLFSYSS